MELISIDMQFAQMAKQFKLKRKDANIPLNVVAQNQSPLLTEYNRQDIIRDLRIDLPDYAPSKEMLDSMKLKFNTESLIVNNPMLLDYLENWELEFYNACSIMKTLLTIEDISNLKLYASLVESNVKIDKARGGCYSFKLSNCDMSINLEELITAKMDEVVLVPKCSLLESPLPSSLLCLMPHTHEKLGKNEANFRHVVIVEKVKGNIIFFRYRFANKKILRKILSEKLTVIIRPTRTPVRLMYRSLEILQQSPLDRLYLYPFPAWLNKMIENDTSHIPYWMRIKTTDDPLPPLKPLSLINKTIGSNPEQLGAIERIVAGPNFKGPFIVFGPPGTGKTTTIVEAILQLHLNKIGNKILVTAGSNSACNTIAERLCEYFERTNLVILDEEIKKQRNLLRLFSCSICEKGLNSVSEILLKYSNYYKSRYQRLKLKEICCYDIVVATLCTVGRLAHEGSNFTHIFIDEAGASTEPEALIGIMGIRHTKNCHVILSGDHKQLGAVLKSNRASDLGLNRSLMERLLNSEYYKVDDCGNYDLTLQARLRRNYRSHPEIVQLYNTLYYNGELIAEASIQKLNCKLLPNEKFPIIFQATHGKMQKESMSTSSYNNLEIQVVCWYVRRLLEDDRMHAQQEDIGIVAPYLAQGRMLAKQLKRQGHNQVEVGTVESFQGREKPIIIVTLVRSFKSIGFMQNPRRINVFLSRAKSLLILVGNPVTLRYNSDFEFIINECKRHGTYLFKEKKSSKSPLPEMEDSTNEDEVEDLINKVSKLLMGDACKTH